MYGQSKNTCVWTETEHIYEFNMMSCIISALIQVCLAVITDNKADFFLLRTCLFWFSQKQKILSDDLHI